MRNGFQRINCILHFIGGLLEILGLVLLLPLVVVLAYWGQMGDGWLTATAFVVTSLISFSLGLVLRNKFESDMLDTTGSMLMCALGWLIASALGALPFVIAIGSNCLDAYFEAMSGFTTTGITVFSGLDNMPRSILFWRSLTQWMGGIGEEHPFLEIAHAVDGRHRNTFIFPYGYFPVGRGSSYVRRREPQDFLGQAHAGTIPHSSDTLGDIRVVYDLRGGDSCTRKDAGFRRRLSRPDRIIDRRLFATRQQYRIL